MKGFFIFLFLFVGSVVVFMSYYQEIGQWYMAKVVEEEGGTYPNAPFEKLKADNPEEFKAKFEKDLKARLYIAKFADLDNKEEYFLKIAAETKEMYMRSPLAATDGMSNMIFNLAEYYQDNNHYLEAYNTFKDFMEIDANGS